jgi:uncharacterized iron-regulated membrane protein
LPQPRPEPAIDWHTAHDIGHRLMAEQAGKFGFKPLREDSLAYSPDTGVYYYAVMSDHNIFEGFSATSVSFDGDSGQFLGGIMPADENAGLVVTFWLFALHTGNVFGLPYKIFLCGLGFVVAMLSATGVYLWRMKQRAQSL